VSMAFNRSIEPQFRTIDGLKVRFERSLAFAMQKVEGSSPFIRSPQRPRKRGFLFAETGDESRLGQVARSGLR
jgi:hypothetical protein